MLDKRLGMICFLSLWEYCSRALGPVYCIDLCVKDVFDEVVGRLLLVAILVG